MNETPLHILHLSALQLWAMKGQAGMCCLMETLRGHQRAGYRVAVVVPRYDLWDDDPSPVSSPATPEFEVHVAPCVWMPAMKRARAVVRRLGEQGLVAYAARWVVGVAMWGLLTGSLFWAAAKLIYRRKRRFDMVYAHNQYAALAGYCVRLVARVPNVTRLYGTFLADLMKKPLVLLRYPIACAGFLVPHKLLICANDGTRGDEVARRLGLDMSRFRFWQDGVDRRPRNPALSRDDFLKTAPPHLRKQTKWIVSCSRLSYWKRIDRILRAAAVCKRAGVACQFLMAGDGPEREPLADLAAELGLGDMVVWLGAVPHAQVWDLMGLADAFVLSNDVTNRCNPLFEAIRAGLPVVSIVDPSTADLLVDGENALLAERDDVEGLGACLLRICTEDGLAERMQRAQQSRDSLLWTWQERMALEARDLAVLGGKSPPAVACGPGHPGPREPCAARKA